MSTYDEIIKNLRKEQADPFSKASSVKRAKSLPTKTTTYTSPTTKKTSSNSLAHKQTKATTYTPKTHKSVSSLTPEAEKVRSKAIADSKTMQFAGGAAYGLMPVAPSIDADKETTAVKAGEVVGTIGSYLTGYGLAKSGAKIGTKTATKLLGKELGEKGVLSTSSVASKWLTGKTGKALVSKIAKNKTIQKLAKTELQKASGVVTKTAIKELAEKKAKGIALSAATDVIADATVGTVLDAAQVKKQGVDLISKEGAKQMAINAGINVVGGGLIEGASPVLKSLANTKSTKATVKVLNALLETKEVENKSGIKAMINNGQFSRVETILAKAPDKVVKNLDEVKAVKKAETVIEDIAKKELPTKTLKADLKASENVNGTITPKDAKNLVTEQLDSVSGTIKDKANLTPLAKQRMVTPTIKTTKLSNIDQAKQFADTLNDTKAVKNVGDFKTLKETTPLDLSKSAIAKQDKLLTKAMQEHPETSTAVKKLYKSLETEEGQQLVIDSVFKDSLNTKTVANTKVIKEAMSDINGDIKATGNLEHSLLKLEEMAIDKTTSRNAIAKSRILVSMFENAGDDDNFQRALASYVSMASESGGTLQLAGRLSDKGRTYLLDTTVKRFIKQNGKKVKVDGKMVMIDYENLPALKEMLTRHKELVKMSAETLKKKGIIKDDAVNASMAEIILEMWNSTPTSKMEIFDMIRVSSMLLNGKTHIRNLLGNSTMATVKSLANEIEFGLQKLTRVPVSERTVAGFMPNIGANTAYYDVAEESFIKNVFDKAKKDTKFSINRRDNASALFSQNADNKIAPVRGLLKGADWITKGNMRLLDAEDVFFIKPAYKKFYAGFIKAKGLDPTMLTPEMKAAADEFAYTEAKNSTFRDANAMASWLTDSIQKWQKSDNRLTQLGGAATSVLFPFVKIPLNIAKAFKQYQPLELVESSIRLVKAGNTKDYAEVVKATNQMAKGLTGTAVAGLGAYLAKEGIFNVSRNDSSTVANYDDAQGEQEYAIKIGDNSFSIDWATPAIFALSIGAELYNHMQTMNQDKGILEEENLVGIYDMLGDMSAPMFEQTIINNLTSAVDTKYTDESMPVFLFRYLVNSAINQTIPVVIGQVAKGISPYKESSTSTMETSQGRAWEQNLNQMKSKTGLSAIQRLSGTGNELAPKYDVWGRVVDGATTTGQKLGKFAESLFSPSQIEPLVTTDVDKELAKLNSQLSEEDKNSILPTKSYDYDVTYDGKDMRMTPQEYSEYSKVRGSTAYSGLQELFRTNVYARSSVEEKKDAINKVYADANVQAKNSVITNRGYTAEDIEYTNIGTVSKTRFMDTSYADRLGKEKAQDIYMKLYDSDVRSANGTFLAEPLKETLDASKTLSNQEKGEVFAALSTATNPYGNFFKPIKSVNDTTAVTAERFKDTDYYENRGDDVYVMIYNSPIRRESGSFDLDLLEEALNNAKTYTQAEKREIYSVFSSTYNPF